MARRVKYDPKEGPFDPEDLERVHAQAMERWGKAYEYACDERERVNEDHIFCDEKGGQWGRWKGPWGNNRKVKRMRLEINQVKHVRNIILGDYRSNRIGVKIRPAGGGSDEELAALYNGIIRNDMNNCDARAAFDNAHQELVTGGIGAFQMATRYKPSAVAGLDAFDQDIVVKPILDCANSVWVDPDSTDENHRDAQYIFVIKDLTPTAFRERYPDATAGDFGMRGINGPAPNWRAMDYIRIADYYCKEPYKTVISEWKRPGDEPKVYEEKELKDVRDELMAEGWEEGRSREIWLDKVWHYKLSGSEVLKGPNLWPGRFIPVIVGYGYNGRNDGDRWYHGVVRPAIDPQRLHNTVFSSIGERCSKSVKDFYWMTPEMQAGHTNAYAKANVEDRFTMPFNFDQRVPSGPQPSRQATMDPNLVLAMQETTDAIRRTTGFGVAATGDTQERSGAAIVAQQRQGDLGTYVLQDNFAKAVNYFAEQCLDVYPRILDTERQMRVMDESGQTRMVTINHEVIDEETGQPVLLNDLSQGKYDVVADTGPAFNTKRQEALNFFTQILQTSPELARLFTPFLVKWMDIPFQEELNSLVSWWSLQAGLRPPTPEEQQEMANRPPDPMQVLQFEGARAELEKMVVEIDEKELGNDKTRAEIAETYAKMKKLIAEAAQERGFATPGDIEGSRAASEALAITLEGNIAAAEQQAREEALEAQARASQGVAGVNV